jgi:hypothetical protein
VLIGTPGRLHDVMKRLGTALDTRKLEVLVRTDIGFSAVWIVRVEIMYLLYCSNVLSCLQVLDEADHLDSTNRNNRNVQLDLLNSNKYIQTIFIQCALSTIC